MQKGTITTIVKKITIINQKQVQAPNHTKRAQTKTRTKTMYAIEEMKPAHRANEAQELIGKDNDAIGFNDQSDNLQPFSTSA